MRFAGDGVVPFGEWLTSQGVPVGFAVAAAITALEVLGTPLYAAGWFVPPLSAAYASIYVAGIAMVHAREGWFVVGAGRNGAEYSVLLIVCLLCVGLQHASRTTLRSRNRPRDQRCARHPLQPRAREGQDVPAGYAEAARTSTSVMAG